MQDKHKEYQDALEKLYTDCSKILGDYSASRYDPYRQEYEEKSKKEEPSLAYKEVKDHLFKDYPRIKVAALVKGILSCVAVLALILMLQQSNEEGLVTSSTNTLDPLRNIPLFAYGIFPVYIVLLVFAALETVFYLLWLDIVTMVTASYLLGMSIYVVLSNPFTNVAASFYLSLVAIAFLALGIAIFFPRPYARMKKGK